MITICNTGVQITFFFFLHVALSSEEFRVFTSHRQMSLEGLCNISEKVSFIISLHHPLPRCYPEYFAYFLV